MKKPTKPSFVETRHIDRAVVTLTPIEKKRVLGVARDRGLTVGDLIRDCLNIEFSRRGLALLAKAPATGAAGYRPAAEARGQTIPHRGGRPRKTSSEPAPSKPRKKSRSRR